MAIQPENFITLAGGRKLCYAVFGPEDGHPVFYFHGNPSSRLELLIVEGLEETLARLGLRVIAIDRPGIGGSDFQPGRKITDWPADVLAVASHLNLPKFALLSYSAGGPYLLACAALIPPEQIVHATMVSGISRAWSAPGALQGVGAAIFWQSARWFPPAMRFMLKMMGNPNNPPPKDAKQAMMAEPDYAALYGTPGMAERFMRCSFGEATRLGADGVVYEARLYWKPFGVELEKIQVPVELWHGDQDRNAPLHHAEYAVERIPSTDVHFISGEGHISLYVKYFEEIFTSIANAF